MKGKGNKKLTSSIERPTSNAEWKRKGTEAEIQISDHYIM